METQVASFSFLAAGPMYVAEIPATFERLPMKSSPLNNGVGARSFDFLPSFADSGIHEAVRLVRSLASPQGLRVDVFERIGEPLLWWVRWTLSNGFLYSHLREEDGLALVDTVVGGLSLIEDDTGAPALIPEPPLSFAASSRPGSEETVYFFSPDLSAAVGFQRPEYLGAGIEMKQPGVETPILRLGTGLGVEVWVSGLEGSAEAEEVIQAAAASLAI